MTGMTMDDWDAYGRLGCLAMSGMTRDDYR